MRRPLAIAGLVAMAAALLAAPGAGAGDADAARLKRCHTKDSFTTGPFFADQVRARGVSCKTARGQVKRWGRTHECVYPDGPNDHVCRSGGYRCVSRSVAYETSRATCKRGKGRAVGFRFGS